MSLLGHPEPRYLKTYKKALNITTLSITIRNATSGITTVSITTFSITTFSMKGVYVTLTISDT
jgi:hypothetical protein